MPWRERDTMSLREEFVIRARMAGTNIRSLCREYAIAPATAYKWLARYEEGGEAVLADRSRRPLHSPSRLSPAVEARILVIRDTVPAWGPRKIRKRLEEGGIEPLPSVSTIAEVLKRHGRIDARESAKHRPYQRFAWEQPNQLWQMDFKGHFALLEGRCHPLTVLDDASRYLVALEACGDELGTTVQTRLTAVFRDHGLPERILVDNGAPWGSDAEHRYTPLTVWLMLLGVGVAHSRPYHPQTQGKAERLHRTLKAELLSRQPFASLAECQRQFDWWRVRYNFQRPHQALGDRAPASRYRPSARPFPEQLPELEYDATMLVRKVQAGGEIWLQGRPYRVGNAFRGYRVALTPTDGDGVWDVWFAEHRVGVLDQQHSHFRPGAGW